MKKFQLIGQGLQSGYPSVTAQERVNCYVEQLQDAESTRTVVYGTPGLSLFKNMGDRDIRAIVGIDYSLGVVYENRIYAVNNAGTSTLVGCLTTTSGRCDVANNGAQTIFVDGTDQARLLDTSNLSSVYITLPESFGSVCYLDSYFIGCADGTQKFYISGQYDGTTWNALDFASAESNPDNLLRVFSDHGQLMLFGQFTVEVWGNNGAQDFPFQRVATPTEWGLAAKWSVAKLDNAVAFLGRNRLGQVQVVMMTGYTPQRISTNDIERIINSDSSYPDATAYSYLINGHSMYVLNVSGRTFMFDLLSNLWSELKSGEGRHLSEMSTSFLGRTLVTDYSNGNIYNLTEDVYSDNGTASVLSITGKHLTNDRELLVVHDIEIDMEHGVGLQSGQGSNPQLMFSVSKNGGHTFGAVRNVDIGAVGDYTTRTRISRLGQCRDFVFKLSISDPIKRAITGVYLRAE